jgi:tripartite-type tricarboxylate transporter receptor subunit TctC
MHIHGKMVRWLSLGLACLLSQFVLAAAAHAQGTSDKVIRLIVPWPPGGNADVVGRTIADKLGENLGQRFVVENRAGAGGNIGMELASKAPADGATLALVISANAVNVSLYPKLGFDLVRDFAPIGPIAALPLILVVHPSVPANSLKELIDLARAQPGRLNYASGGNGTVGHLAAEMFKSMARVQITHIPYKGATPAVTDLIGGQVQVFFDGTPSALPHVKAGRLRVLAITTAKRSPALPEVPTVAEAGLPGFEVTGWFGLMAPAGTDAAQVARLNAELNRAIASAEVRARFASLGLEPMSSTPQQFGALVQAEIAKWGKVVKEAGVRLD